MPMVAQNSEERPPFPWRWFAAMLAIILLRALPNLRFPIGRDQATCCVIAQRMLEGLSLYRDLWDNRPPGIFFLYAPFVKLLGPVMWVPALADILVVLVASALLFRFAHRHLGAPAAAIGAVAAAAFHCSAGYTHAAQPDGLLMVFVFAALALLTRDRQASSVRTIFAGVMLGAAFWVKYNSLAFAPFVVLAPFLDWSALDAPHPRLALNVSRREFLRRVALVAAGFAALFALVAAAFWMGGAWAAFREAQFDVLLRYSATSFAAHRSGVWAIGELYRHVGPWNHAGVAVALVVAWRRRELSRMAPVALGLFAGLAAILLPGRLHNYYVEMVFPFYGLAWGYVVVTLLDGFRRGREFLTRRNFRLALALSGLTLANVLFALVLNEALHFARDARGFAQWARNPRAAYEDYFPQNALDKFEDQMKVIDFLRSHSAASDGVYVWGTAPLINFLSERRSPSRFVSNLALVSPWGPERWRAELIRELEARPPLYMVLARRDAVPSVSNEFRDSEQFLQTYTALAGLISTRYERAMSLRGFDVYRRK